ncbi:unnamed protein product [Malus baccata var. baccata]
MKVLQILHMNQGNGETSYAQNSTGKMLSTAKSIIDEAIQKMLCLTIAPNGRMGIADLGCSSGPNTLLLISEIIDAIHATSSSSSSSIEFRVFLNDLISNDFNTLFMSLPAFYNQLKEEKGAGFGSVFISAVPGSFYGRLFPAKSLHFVHSSSSLHWLSQMYISKTSPQCVLDAYSLQFHKDFFLFLKSRAEEIVGGGRMVLSLLGRSSADPSTQESCYVQWELLAHALMRMVSEGLIEEERVDSFNAPFYAPSEEELKLVLQNEGSFTMDRLEAFEIDWDGDAEITAVVSGQRMAKTIRAVTESMIESHFGKDIMDDLFRQYAELCRALLRLLIKI